MAAHISISKQLQYAQNGEMGGVDVREPSTAIFAVSSIDRYQTPNNQTSGGGLNSSGGTIVGQKAPPIPNDGFSLGVVNPLYPLGVANPTSPYDFIINSNQNLLAGFFTRIAVSEVIFRYTLPTLTSRNNKMYIVWAPSGRSATTAVTGTSTAVVTFTMASTTGYSSGQTIIIGDQAAVTVGGVVYQVNGTYTISTTTGTTLVCNNPNSLPSFAIVTQSGTVGIRYLLTIAEGWYDLTNTTAGSDGNLAAQVQAAVRTATGSSTFTLVYNQLSSTSTTGPFNAFNAVSGNTDKFWWLRYTDASAPSRVGLFEMMSWESTQLYATFQYGDPNVSLLSTPFVDITCDQLTYNQGVKDADTGLSHNILCRVYIVPDAFTGNMANLGSGPILVHRAFPFPKQVRWRANQNIGGGLRFQVWDSQGYLLTTNEGVTGATAGSGASLSYFDADMGDWTMTMLCSEV
jgi:hypothetical protein